MRASFDALGEEWTAIDGNDVQEEGQWRRADDTDVEYFNWHEFEPNNYLAKEHYIVTWKNGHSMSLTLTTFLGCSIKTTVPAIRSQEAFRRSATSYAKTRWAVPTEKRHAHVLP